MNKKFYLFGVFLLFLVALPFAVFGQPVSVELAAAISAGDVTLSVSGNGRSMGLSLSGTLINNTSNDISINVSISGGLYLQNSGSGQNMVATRIIPDISLGLDLGSAGSISLSANGEITVTLNAFCANYDLEIPTSDEAFSTATMPLELQEVLLKINRYESDHLGENLDRPIQLAIWNTQGVDMSVAKFLFDSDWITATKIMNY